MVELLKVDLIEEAERGARDEVLRVVAVISGKHLMFARFEPPAPSDRVALAVPTGGALAEGSPAPPAGELPFHRDGPTLLGYVTVAERRYQQKLVRRASGLRGLPALLDEWVVDLYDGTPAT